MKVEFSKEFEKAVCKLSGKMLDSVRHVVQEVINAENITEAMSIATNLRPITRSITRIQLRWR